MLKLRLFEVSPAWTIEDDTLIGYDLAFTRGLRLVGLDTTCDTSEALEDLSRRLNEVLCAIPEGSIVRFCSLELDGYRDVLASFQAQFPSNSVGAYVAHKKVEQCDSGLASLKRELYCFVSTPGLIRAQHYRDAILGRRAGKFLKRAKGLHAEKIEEVNRLQRTVARAFGGTGIVAEPLDAAALFAVTWRMANPLSPLGPPDLRRDFSLRGQLFASGLVEHMDLFQREGRLNRVLTLKVPPKQVLPTQIMELQTLPFPHQLVVTLRRVSDQDARRRVELNRNQGRELNRLLARFRGAERHAELPDYALIQQQADANDVLARLTAGEKLYDVATQLWLSGTTPDDLAKNTELALSRFRACGQAEGAVEELRGRFAFASMLPGHHGLIGDRFHPFLATRAADLLPVYQAPTGAKNPTAILSTREKQLVGFHPFDPTLPAWNATVAGGTGSGKSFATRILLTGWLARGGRVVIATRGRDYHRFAEIFGGTLCDISLEDPNLALGPFPTPSDVAKVGPERALEHLTSILAIMVVDGSTGLDRLARRLLYNATRALYDKLGPGASAPTFREWLAELEAIAASEPDSAALATQLSKQIRFWTEGPYGAVFCRNRKTFDDAPLSVWNLDQVHDRDTQGVVLAVLSGVIAQSIQSAPTVVVLDEVWSLFKSEAGAALVESLYRTVRKEGSAIWTISQSMNDYVALPDATKSAILNNSPIKMFLSHDSSELDLVSSTFRLSCRETELLASLKSKPGRFSDMLMFLGKHRLVVRLVPTGIEYWLATSHPKDCDWERLALKEHPNLDRLELLKRLGRSYPHGAINIQGV